MVDRKTGRTRKKISNALMGLIADSDSCDSTAQKEFSGTNSAWDSEDKKHKKKKTSKTFSKGWKGLISTIGDSNNSSANNNNNKARKNIKNERAPIEWDIEMDTNKNFKKRDSFDTLEEEDEEDDDEEEEDDDVLDEPIPKLPKGKKMVDTIVGTDVDSLYRSVFGNDTFFEIVNSKAYEECRAYECSDWSQNRSTGLWERHMTYVLSKTIAFTQHHVNVKQTQTRSSYCHKGLVYGVDTITQNTGVAYSDYFRLNIHYRFLQTENPSQSQLLVIADIEFVKPCLFKGRIESEAWSGLKKYYDVVSQEVQLEKDIFDEIDHLNNMSSSHGGISYSKLLKDSLNYKRLNSMNTCDHCHNKLREEEGNNHNNKNASVFFSPEVLMVSFMLVILVLLMLTVALFKMSATIANLDERMMRVEEAIERNGRFFQIIMQQEDLLRK